MASPLRTQLLASLTGQKLCVPDLCTLFEHWPQAVNPVLDPLNLTVPDILRSFTSSPRKLAKLNKAEFGLFAASWWPTANLYRARIVACLAIWLFIWDDEIDAEVGALSGNFNQAQDYRNETIRWIQYCLRLSSESCPTPSNPIIGFFKVIGDAVCESSSLPQRETLLKELELFMETSELEQRRRLSPALPSLEEYVNCRMGTSAVNVTTWFNEFVEGVALPTEVMEDPDMRCIWHECNVIVWAVNDLLSLKKEIEQQTVDSLVPLLYHQVGNLDAAVAMIFEAVQQCVARFDDAAERLQLKHAHDAALARDLQRFVDACRYNCTGNLHWSLRTGRYGVCQKSIAGGVTVQL